MFDEFSKIEAYVNGRLTASETREFEQAMDNDKELRIIVENHELYSVVADEIINENISRLITKNQGALQDSSKSAITKLIFGLILVSLITIVYFLMNRGSNGDNLYAEFYSPPMGNTVRGDQENNDDLAPCYEAHHKLEEGDVDGAKLLFIEAQKADDLLCREKAFYYMGLIYVKDNDFDNARKKLNEVLLGGESGYERKANELLLKI